MIGMWYTEAGKYNVLPIDSRGVQRIAEERPQIAAIVRVTRSIPAHNRYLRPRRRKFLTGPIASQRKWRCRRMAPRVSCSAWAAMTAASRSICRRVSSASFTTTLR